MNTIVIWRNFPAPSISRGMSAQRGRPTGTPPAQTLVVPPEIRQDVNIHSGYLGPRSQYYEWNLKRLFHSAENMRYVHAQVRSLIIHPKFVAKYLPSDDADPDGQNHSIDTANPRDRAKGLVSAYGNRTGDLREAQVRRLVTCFREPASQRLLYQIIPGIVESHRVSPPEDMQVANPVMQLHVENLDFIVVTARGLIESPTTLRADYYNINPDTGEVDRKLQHEATDSWADGTWHPEHLFVKRDQVYWTPLEVNYASDPAATGPGHRYNRAVYHDAHLRVRSRANPQSRLQSSMPGRPEQFPRWQYSVNDRPYEHSTVYNDETMSGEQDRRTQYSRGYDMSSLMSRSTY
jgi:hypothetical protein